MIKLNATTPSVLHVVQESVAEAPDAVNPFAHLTAGGTLPGSILLQSAETTPTTGRRSLGIYRPSLMVRGSGNRFVIEALDARGAVLLPDIARRLPPAVNLQHPAHRRQLHGELPLASRSAAFTDRLRETTAAGVLRAALLQPDPASNAAGLVGLYGCFAYDFVRQFEAVPIARQDPLQEPDYLFYLATRLFVIDHATRCTTLMSVIPAVQSERFRGDAERDLANMRNALQADPPQTHTVHLGRLQQETSRQDYCSTVSRIQESIGDGTVFQVVYGHMMHAEFSGDAFAVYQALQRYNPAPYAFYLRDARGALLGASPELAVGVTPLGDIREVTLKPIAGTKPRGRRNGTIDPALDERWALALQVDPKELAEHTMLIDLARNDLAAVCEPGSVRLRDSLAIERYTYVQHLVSRISGTLRGDLDALDAYVATMNMGTLTGAPKPQAMQLIARHEHSARGFFGGGIGYLTADGGMQTAIVIRAIRITANRAYIRAGAGIVADSIPEHEWLETLGKAQACIHALQEAAQ